MYQKSMREALQEARDYRDTSDTSDIDEWSYRGYEIKRQNNKYGHPLNVPALKLTGANMKDIKQLIDRHFLFSNEEVQLDEFTISDIQQMVKKGWVNKISPEKMKELQKINQKNNGNITRQDLQKVGFSALKIMRKEADLSKTQVKMVHDKADELPKHDFIKRYGKDGDSVRYATATNIVKKKLGIGEEVTEETSPEVADVLKKFVTANPLRFHGGPGLQGGKNKRDFIELQKLALSNMDKFRKKYNDMKAKRNEDNYNQKAVRDALEKAGLSKHLTDENKIEGDETMNESYKDKFNAAMKKFGINSLDDLKTDADKKKFFKHVDSIHTADHEEVKEEKLNEKKADFLRLNFANNQTVKKVDRWAYNNLGHANQGFTSMIPDEHGKSIEWEDIDDADELMAKLKKAGFSFTVDMREEG